MNPLINITLECELNDVIITIEDNAGGIPVENLNKIFEPYFTTKHKNLGTGLGLHSVQKIIKDSLSGNIEVKNIDNGAKFIIYIPLNRRKQERRQDNMPIQIDTRNTDYVRREDDK